MQRINSKSQEKLNFIRGRYFMYLYEAEMLVVVVLNLSIFCIWGIL